MNNRMVRVPPITRYTVSGSLAFPVDMLRYDAAWPASEFDSHKIERSVQFSGAGEGIIEVQIYARGALNSDRWRSFGWVILRADAVVNL